MQGSDGGRTEDFDPLAGDPQGQLTALRAAGHRVFRSPGMGGAHLVLRHSEVDAVLKDHATYSSAYALGGPLEGINPPEVMAELPAFLRGPVTSVVDADPPAHDELRRTVLRAFAGPRINRLAPRIEQLAQEAVDGLEGRQETDLVAHYARPFVERVMGMVMGIPDEDVPAVARWGADMAALISPVTPLAGRMAAAGRLREYAAWAEAFIATRRAGQDEDVVSIYAHGDTQARPLTHENVLNCLLVHFVAGTVTTGHAITTAVHELLRDGGGLWRRAAADPDKHAAAAVEEGLRFAAPHRGLVRVTTRQTELGGVTLPAGAMVVPMLASAGRDEEHFPDGDEFRPGRPDVRDHLSFSTGVHGCVGAHLARLEGRVAVSVLLRRMPALRLSHPERTPAVGPDFFFHGLESLPVTP